MGLGPTAFPCNIKDGRIQILGVKTSKRLSYALRHNKKLARGIFNDTNVDP